MNKIQAIKKALSMVDERISHNKTAGLPVEKREEYEAMYEALEDVLAEVKANQHNKTWGKVVGTT